MRATLATVALALFAGCASFATMKTARAIDPGTSEVMASVGAIGASVPRADGNGNVAQIDPQFEFGVRYGVVPGFDLGAKVWTLGGEVDATISIIRSRYFDLALAPSLGLISYSYGTACDQFGNCGGTTNNVLELFGKVPLLFGLRFGPRGEHEFVFGPEVVPIGILSTDYFGYGSSTSGLLVGGLAGVSMRVSPWLRMMPELTVLVPAVAFAGASNQVIDNYGQPGAVFVQAQLGFAWGNDGLEHPRYSPPPDRRYYAPPPERRYDAPPRYVPPQPAPSYDQAPPPQQPYRSDE